MVSIYALINPINDQVFYIGASKTPNGRLCNHLINDVNYHKSKQIKSILSMGFKPELLILEECDIKDVRRMEEFYIEIFMYYGFKLNQMKNSSYADGIKRENLPTTIRLPTDMYNALKEEAIKQDRSLHWLVFKILKDFVTTLKHNN